jgi:dihydrofolate reductase
MRRVRYQVATSLDGYIAGPKGESDWIVMDPDIDFAAHFAQFDTILLGRTTYEATLKMQGSADFGMCTYVFSHTLKQSEHPNVTIVKDGAKELLERLRNEEGKDIWLMGGGVLFRSLLELGVVDTVEVAIVPVVLGGGVAMLPTPAPQTKLTLTKRHVYEKTGIVSLEYSIRR